mmetsp:Transcript_74103/g.118052  ORF Transcript_74103/g.118052 Transcript_74103/m.118052 type:complete len:216 (-) Transcript_74103:173-820(-)
MLPKGPFQSTDFTPDIPETFNRVKDTQTKDDEDAATAAHRLTARDYIDREQQEKEDYRKRRIRDDKEIEEYRQNARFAQTDYSSFDSEVVDRPIETYYCCFCGNYCLVMECRLKDCAQRFADDAYGVDIVNQVCKFPGIVIGSQLKVMQKANDKLEIQYMMSCQQCSLPIAYRHYQDIKQCPRIFVFNDSISNDPTCVQKKIYQLKQTLSFAKGV